MKKIWVFVQVITVAWVFSSCTSLGSLEYSEPVFDKPFVYVIDSFKGNGSIEDYVKLHNSSIDSNIRFNVYIHDPSSHEWLIYGTGSLKDAGDTDTIDSGMDDIDHYRYFAIESLNGKNYNYQVYKSHNDLHITIFDN
jgi:hypothetical protein